MHHGDGSSPAREALRQQLLLRALWPEAGDPPKLAGWLREPADRAALGLAACRGHARATARRALAGSCPTVAALLGEADFAAMAWRLWQARPPERGDLGCWGQALAELLAGDEGLHDRPWLGDLARLDWAVHVNAGAADSHAPPAGLDRLAEVDPAGHTLRLRPGTAVLGSRWPLATLWTACRDAPVEGATLSRLLGGPAEHALVWRSGWRAAVTAIPAGDAAFMQCLLEGQPLGPALDDARSADPGWSFEAWLLDALRQGWIDALVPAAPAAAQGAAPDLPGERSAR